MERNTKTSMFKLLKGDRFYFTSDTKRKGHCVMKVTDASIYYNIVHANGSTHWQYDRMARPEREVIFLRHKNDL